MAPVRPFIRHIDFYRHYNPNYGAKFLVLWSALFWLYLPAYKRADCNKMRRTCGARFDKLIELFKA